MTSTVTPAPSVSSVREIGRDVFSYSILFSSLVAGTSDQQNLQIDVDSNFLWQKSYMFATIANASTTSSSRVIPNVTIIVTDSGSSRSLMNQGVPVDSLFGNGELPFVLPNPRTLRGGANISFNVSNFDASSTYNLYLTLFGQKIFYG